jgi:hypothetical protein
LAQVLGRSGIFTVARSKKRSLGRSKISPIYLRPFLVEKFLYFGLKIQDTVDPQVVL